MTARSKSSKEITGNLKKDLKAGLESLCAENGLHTLLIFMDYGVVWGKMADGNLILSDDDPEVENIPEGDVFSYSALQQAYCFSSELEARIWRVGEEVQVAWLDGDLGSKLLEKKYLLWGTEQKTTESGFIHLTESGRGFQQCVPAPVQNKGKRLALGVTHFLQEDDDGQYFIRTSKLNSIESVEG